MYNVYYKFYLFANALYLFAFPLSRYLDNNFDEITKILFIYSLISFISLLIIPVLFSKYKIKKITSSNKIKPSHLRLKFILLSFIVIFLLKFLYFNTGISYSILFNRMNRELPFYQSQVYVIFILVMQFYFFFFIYYLNYLKKYEKIVLLLLFILFAYHEIVLTGARRYTLAIILFYLISNIGLDKLFKFKYAVLASFIIISMFILGGYRELIVHGMELKLNDAIVIALKNNEFTEIGRGLYYYISQNIDAHIIQGGKSFIDGLQFIIPRFIYPDKPVSLVAQFGVPVSIYSELFLNFHFVGALIIGIYGFLYYILSLNTGFWSIVFYSYILDFIRAQFGVIIYTISILLFLYYIFKVRYVYNNNTSI
jgi:hypothetical protein